MNTNAFIEIQRLTDEFNAARKNGNRLLLDYAALERDEVELNERLATAYQTQQDAKPILKEVHELLLRRAQILKECAENDSLCATLCLQSAKHVKRLAS